MKLWFMGLLPWLLVSFIAWQSFDEGIRERAPASQWLTVKSIIVDDTRVSISPILVIERTIHQPFVGTWVATVRLLTNEGLEQVCIAYGSASYQIENKFPENLNLDWWTFPVKCNLGVGRYRLDTAWTITVDGYPPKIVMAHSNLFNVSF